MKNKALIILMPGLLLFLSLGVYDPAEAGYRGPFEGKVVDAETQEPLEGVVVVVDWHRARIMNTSVSYDAKEVLTDKEGKFYIATKWTWNPWTLLTLDSQFTVFKAGYGHVSFHWHEISSMKKTYFSYSKKERNFPQQICSKTSDWTTRRAFQCDVEKKLKEWNYNIRLEGKTAIFELKKITTKKERSNSLQGSLSLRHIDSQIIPHFFAEREKDHTLLK